MSVRPKDFILNLMTVFRCLQILHANQNAFAFPP